MKTAKLDRPNTIAGLLDKRAEIAGMIKFHRKELQKLVLDLDHIDAAIRLFEPNADLKVVPKRYPTKHRAFKGEVGRLIMRCLREAEGPLTSLEITKVQIAERGLKADPGTVVMMRKRIGACLSKLKYDGVVRSIATDGPYKGWVLTRDLADEAIPDHRPLLAEIEP